MNRKQIICLWIGMVIFAPILGLIIGGAAWYILLQYLPKYTSQTYIEVSPPVEKDPITTEAALVAKDIKYGYRLTMANLIKQHSTLRELIDRDKVRQTQWFKRFGEPTDKAVRKAFKDMEKHFRAYAHRDGDFVEISMTCRYPEEAALIVNEMVNLFVASQGGTKKADIVDKLDILESQRGIIQRELKAIEKKIEPDLAKQQLKIRDEKIRMLNAVKEQIEKLRIIHEDLKTPKVRSVGNAPVPLQVSSPRWELYFPCGAILGFISGIGLFCTGLVLLGRKAENKEGCPD